MNKSEFNESMTKIDNLMKEAKYHLNKAGNNLEENIQVSVPNMTGGMSERTISRSDAIKKMISKKASDTYKKYKSDYE